MLRFQIFRMTRSITHVIKFSMKQTSGRLGTQLIRSGVVDMPCREAPPSTRQHRKQNIMEEVRKLFNSDSSSDFQEPSWQ